MSDYPDYLLKKNTVNNVDVKFPAGELTSKPGLFRFLCNVYVMCKMGPKTHHNKDFSDIRLDRTVPSTPNY